MCKVRANGTVVVTNHSHPEVVIVEVDHHRQLVSEAGSATAGFVRAQLLASLQAFFDARPASLNASSSSVYSTRFDARYLH